MKILITGARGFVGTNLCKYLSEKGHQCVTLDVRNADYDWTEFAKIPFDSCDAIVHLAGKAHDLKKVASEQSYFDINVGLTEKIYGEMVRRGVRGEDEVRGEKGERVKRFIYFSSSKAAVDGNAYGRSKWAAEQFLLSTPPPTTHRSPTTIILRPAMIHGPGNKGNLNLLWGIARRGLPWPLAAFENKRSFTSIGNICAAVEALCERGENGVYPIADDEMISTNRLIELIAETCGKRAKLWRIPKGLMRFAARIGDLAHLPLNTERIEKLTEDSFVDNAALKKLLGWQKMPVSAEDGMRMTLNSFKNN